MERLTSTALLPESFQGTRDDITEQMGVVWQQIKAPVLVPLLRLAVFVCLVMSVMLVVEKVYMAAVIALVKLLGRRPEKRYKWEPIRDDLELGGAAYPMVLVQIPMYNEKEVPVPSLIPRPKLVYQLSVGAACGLSWPADRIIIQVLDDSTDPVTKDLVEMECNRWASKGVHIKYERRDNRRGYKAGALRDGMKRGYVEHCDYVVIFDADFQPEPDFLWRTVPFLIHNPDLALVQARWKFGARLLCLLYRLKLSMTTQQLHLLQSPPTPSLDQMIPSGRSPSSSLLLLGNLTTDHFDFSCIKRRSFSFTYIYLNWDWKHAVLTRGTRQLLQSQGREGRNVDERASAKEQRFLFFSAVSDLDLVIFPQWKAHHLKLYHLHYLILNSDECLMTRIQEMSLDYHFTVEQEVGSFTHAFFGFNGTAGVWRISALNEAGGWKDRTTVEDMDLAVRASLKGWKFLFLGDLKVRNELPSTLKAYRYQQHRWSCGPANLFRKMLTEIASNKVSLSVEEIDDMMNLWKKVHVIYSFFFVRKVVAHIVTFVFYCVVIPATVLIPEVEIPKWGAVYIPSVITLLNAVGTPRSLHLLVFWILFENVMSLHRTKATFIGLLEGGRANEWVVTEKLGDTMKVKMATKAAKKPPRTRIGDR
ncbi:hypothetical protein BHM03_00005044 [Ensete ventricosum]|uniref:Glycosyltransferase 2-like domain-containing protein n=1 Tax=Ensete ventricosum TaxID=4639 RepID=A0A445MB02_ENSVE|nr:hypothetical protein BHM03_00005044 [Ensete ventricosum]